MMYVAITDARPPAPGDTAAVDQLMRSFGLEVSLGPDPVEGVVRSVARADQRYTGYLELIQILEAERCAARAMDRTGDGAPGA